MATFSSAVMVGDQVERLEHDAEPVAPETGEFVFVQEAEVVTVDDRLAAGCPFESADDHEQARLAGAGRADDADGLAGAGGEIDTAQDLDRPGEARQGQRHILEEDQRRAGRNRRRHSGGAIGG